jgi:hypothetical protein
MPTQPAAKWNRADFRLHPGLTTPEPHWLLNHLHGRALLASELRRVRPDLHCPRYMPGDDLLTELDGIIDRLGLRKWTRPVGVREQFGAICAIVGMYWALEMEQELSTARQL